MERIVVLNTSPFKRKKHVLEGLCTVIFVEVLDYDALS